MEKGEKENAVEESWSIKRILFVLVLLFLVLSVGAYFVLGEKTDSGLSEEKKIKDSSVLGIVEDKNSEEKKEINLPLQQKQIEEVLIRVKEDVEKITPESIASSSPEIQKVINDIKIIEQYKNDPVNIVCDIMCKK